MSIVNAQVGCWERHALPSRLALLSEGQNGRRAPYTLTELSELSARFANFPCPQGVGPGDRLAGFLPRAPKLLILEARHR